CGTLVAAATRVNIHTLLAREPNNQALARYLHVAEILCEKRFIDPETAFNDLVDLLTQWTEELALPRLSHYGLQSSGFDKVIANCRGNSMKTNPIVLADEEIRQILLERL
ncbi:MAG: alcohol dehydrogenase, partial [Nitrosomonas sp.]